jgi:6-phosphogluconolactonase (cycloisomerase 2 family)
MHFRSIRDRATSMAVTPDSRFLYVLNTVWATGNSTLTPYAIDPSTGALTAGATMTPAVNGPIMAIDPHGRFLYLTNSATVPLSASSTVLTYTIDSLSGGLTASGSGTVVASNAAALAADPNGQYLYVLDSFNFTANDDAIIALSVDQSTGALAQIGAPVLIGSQPAVLACDASGAFLFTSNIAAAGLNNAPFTDLTSFTITLAGANAGEVAVAGQGAVATGSPALAIAE